jgi:hypothetical protein
VSVASVFGWAVGCAAGMTAGAAVSLELAAFELGAFELDEAKVHTPGWL